MCLSVCTWGDVLLRWSLCSKDCCTTMMGSVLLVFFKAGLGWIERAGLACFIHFNFYIPFFGSMGFKFQVRRMVFGVVSQFNLSRYVYLRLFACSFVGYMISLRCSK